MADHILMISEGFAPWGGPAAMRATKLAACGLRRGVQISVLTTATECAHVFDDPELASEVRDAEILRVSNGTDYRGRDAISRSLGYYATRVADRLIAKTKKRWADDCISAAHQRWDSQRPDLVYCTPPGQHVVDIAQRLSTIWDVPFVMDFRDPPWEIGMDAESFGKVLDSCSLAILNTPPAAERIRSEYDSNREKVECWTNGVDPPQAELRLQPRKAVPLSLLFAGGIYPWVVDAIQHLRSWIAMEKIIIDVYAFRETKRRRQVAALRRLGAIVHVPISNVHLTKKMSDASANLVTLPPHYQMSSKVYPMLASGRPVVVFGDTESSRAILEDLPGVYSFDASSSDADIERLLANVADYDPEAGWPARYAWLRDKTWPSIFSSIFGRYL